MLLQRKTLLAVAAINFLGTLFGFYYYLPQFQSTPVHLWVFVSDSPIATFAIGLSLVLYIHDKKWPGLDVFAFVANFKYGLWTVFVLIYYFETFWSVNSIPMYIFLLVSHFLMFVQAFLVLEHAEWSFKALVISVTWFLLNDTLDYFLDIHPTLFVEHSHPISPAMLAAYTLTILGLSCYLLTRSSLSGRLRQIRLLQRHD